MKQDWIIANINNPGFSAGDFKSIGLTTNDMQLRPIDDYLKSSQITDNPLFKGSDGNFSKSKFEDFYKSSVSKYEKFSQDFDTFKYDLFDPFRKVDSEVKNPQLSLYQVSNPEHNTTGIIGRNEEARGELTAKELAQQSKVYDPSTGKYLDYSMDEISLFEKPLSWIKQLFSDPVVYATYDSDGTHIDPITGRETPHKKGQYRINEQGEFFTEKLSGRNIRGKEVVSVLDTITSDTSAINKYDFFDSDGFDKSVAGSFFNAAASIAPLFVPVFGEVYSASLVARELSKAIPMLSGMLDALLGTDMQNNSVLNTFAAKGESLTGGTSEYSREKVFSFENVSKLISDVANQWGQQKIIAKGINKLTGADELIAEANANALGFYQGNTILRGQALKASVEAGQMTEEAAASQLKAMAGISNLNELNNAIKTGKWMDSALGRGAAAKFIEPTKKTVEGLNRLAADMSLGYMAIVSNTDVYQSMLDHGASKGEAALFALGSTLGMFSVDKYLGLGEVFFDELRNSNKYIARNIGEMLEPWKNSFANEEAKKGLGKRILDAGKKFGKNYVNTYIEDLKNHTTGFLGKALGEGLEEVSEELVTDFTKELYEQLGKYNITSQKDIGAWDNAASRYLMSFLGGSLGGGIFYGVGVAQGQYPIQAADEDLLFHIRNGKTKDYLDRIDQWEKEGKFGSKELSATQFTETKDGDTSRRVYLTADSEDDTQNHFIAERVRQGILQLDAIIRGNQLDVNDDQLFDNLVMSEQRYMDMKDWLKDQSYAVNYYDTYQNLVKRIVDIEQQIQAADKTKDGTPTGEIADDEWKRNNRDTEAGKTKEENLKKLTDLRDLLLKQRDDFLSADTSFYYTRKMMFALDRQLASNFFPVSFESYLKQQKGLDYNSLNVVDKEKYYNEFIEYQKTQYKETIDEQFDKFLEIEKLVAPYIGELEENSQNFKDYSDKIFNLFTEKSPFSNFDQLDYYSRLEGETDDDVERFKRINDERVSITVNDLSIIEEYLNNIEGLSESEWRDSLSELSKGINILENVKKLYELLPDSEVKTKLGDFIFHQSRAAKIDEINNQRKNQVYTDVLNVIKEVSNKLDPITYRYIIDRVYNRKKDVIKDIVNRIMSKTTITGLSKQDTATLKGIINEIKIDRDGNTNVAEIFQNVKEFIQKLSEQEAEINTKSINDQEDYIYQELAGLNDSVGGDPDSITVNDFIQEFINYIDDHTKNDEGAVDEGKVSKLNEFMDVLNNLIRNYVQNQIENLPAPENESELEQFAEQVDSVNKLIEGLQFNVDGTNNIDSIRENIVAYLGDEGMNLAITVSQILNSIIDLSWGDITELKKNQIEDSLQTESQGYLSTLNAIIEEINSKITQDEDIKFINKIEKTTRINNPFIEFLKKVGKSINLDGIEDLLNELFETINYKLDNKSDFRLIDEQKELLRKIVPEDEDKYNRLNDAMTLIQNYLLAASKTASIMNPYGHNRSVNEFMKKHASELKVKPELLPEISDDTFVIWGTELEKYKLEIKDRIELSDINSVNKQRRFINTKNKFVKARLDFFDTLRPHLKFTIDDKEIDLLEGDDKITTTKESLRIELLEELLFTNFNNLLQQGYTAQQIFENSKILEKLTEQDGRQSFIQQLSTKLDENLEYSDFTLYDRFIYFLSTLSLNNRDWNKFIKEEITTKADARIAPLTIQQLVAKIGASFLSGSNTFRTAIDYLSNNGIIDKDSINILDKSVFISGVGGAGKSRVGVKYIIDYAIDDLGIDQDQIWLSGSTSTVRQNLKTAVVRGVIKESPESKPGKSELIKMAISPTIYEKLMEDINSGKEDSEYYTVTKTDSGRIVTLNWDKIPINQDNAPEILVIDEATHYSTAELQIFNKWVKKELILVGDPNQSGFDKLGLNLDREFSFLVRSPKLRISLRDNNLQNQENQIEISETLDFIGDADVSDPNYSAIELQFVQKVQNLKIRGYLGDGKINGTIYQKSISDEVLSNLSGDVAFVGSKNSDTYRKLSSRSDNFKLEQFDDVIDIQGSEFDYVIVDYNLQGKWAQTISTNAAIGNYFMLKDFYTLVSRAKVGSVFIENGEQIGVNVLDKSSATAIPITDAIKPFTEAQITEIDEYLNTPLDGVTTVKPEVKSEEDDVKTNPEDSETHEDIEEIKGPIEVVSDSNREVLEPVLADNINYPIYTTFNIRGARRSNVREINGVRYPVISKAQDGEVKRGIEIFMTEDLDPLAIEGEDQNNHLRKYNLDRQRYEKYLRNLINGIIYNHEYGELNIVSDLDRYFTKETYDKLKDNIYLVSREVDPERDYIMNPLYGDDTTSEVKPVFGNRIVELVAEVDGISVTLGLILDPEKATNKEIIEKLGKRIDKTIERLEEVRQQEIDEGRITVGDELYNKYKEDINNLTARKVGLKTEAEKYYEAIKNIISQPPNKWKVKIKNNGFSALYRSKYRHSLSEIRKNPNTVTSKVLIYAGKLPGVNDQVMKGRAIVLQSGDTLLTPQQLMDEYIRQRLQSTESNPLEEMHNTPRTRMVCLTSKGFDILDVLNGEIKTPISWHQFGIKAFVSAWNFRANLIQFYQKYQDFLKDNNLSESVVEKVLTNMDDQYNHREGYTYGIIPDYEEIKQKINAFNESLNDSVKQFRLGGREEMIGEIKIGSQYIREIPNANPNFYENPNRVNGIYIHPKRAESFIKTLNNFFKAVNIIVNPVQKKTNDGGETITEPLDPARLITTSPAKNNIQGFITKMQANVDYTIGDITLSGYNAENGSMGQFSAFAIALIKILRQGFGVGTIDRNPDRASYIRDTYNDETKVLKTNIKVGKEEVEINTRDIFNETIISQTGSDLSFERLFRLILHGTTEKLPDLQNQANTNVPKQATDAYFKNGIYIEPKKGNKINDYFYECIIEDDFFESDAIARSSTVSIDFSQREEEEKKKEEEEEIKQRREQERINALISQAQEKFGIEPSEVLVEEGSTIEIAIHTAIREKIDSNIKTVFNNFDPSNENILNIIIGIDNNGEPITLRDKINSNDKGIVLNSITEIESSRMENSNKKITIRLNSGSEIILSYDTRVKKLENVNNKLKVKYISKTVDTLAKGKDILTNILNILTENSEYIQDSDVDLLNEIKNNISSYDSDNLNSAFNVITGIIFDNDLEDSIENYSQIEDYIKQGGIIDEYKREVNDCTGE